jgi:hypothetical protein
MADLHTMGFRDSQINHLTLGITCADEIALLKRIVASENAAKDHKYEVAARVAAEGSEPTGEERARTASLKEEKHGYDAQLKALGERPHESTGHALA